MSEKDFIFQLRNVIETSLNIGVGWEGGREGGSATEVQVEKKTKTGRQENFLQLAEIKSETLEQRTKLTI